MKMCKNCFNRGIVCDSEVSNINKVNCQQKESVSPVIQVICNADSDDFDFEMATTCLSVDLLPVVPAVNFDIGFDDFMFEQNSENASPVKAAKNVADMCLTSYDTRIRHSVVKTPPPLEEVSEALATLGDTGWISPIDVLQLVDMIKRERQLNISECRESTKPNSVPACKNSSECRESTKPTNFPACKRSNDESSSNEDRGQSSIKKNRLSVPKSSIVINCASTSRTSALRSCVKDITNSTDDYSLKEYDESESTLHVNRSVSSQHTLQVNRPVSVSSQHTPQVKSKVSVSGQHTLDMDNPVVMSAQVKNCETPHQKRGSGEFQPFDDDFDDLILAEFSTPVSASHSNIADNSQLTFTQALACVNESINMSKIGDIEKSSSNKIGTVIDKFAVEEPQFDLGFNLSDLSSDDEYISNNDDDDDGDDNDDDIIPPSPDAVAPRRSRLSLLRYGGSSQSLKISVLPETPINESLCDKFNVENSSQSVSDHVTGTQPFSVQLNNKVTFHLSSDEDDEILVAASVLDADCPPNIVLPVAIIQPSIRMVDCIISPDKQQGNWFHVL